MLAEGPAGLERSAIIALIKLLGDEPALGLALVDANAHTITGNRRFAALTVPQGAAEGATGSPPAKPPTSAGSRGDSAARRGVWARVGPDAVRTVRTSGGPAMLRFIHEGVQVQCDVWPLPAPDAPEGGARPSDAGEPEAFLVVAVEGRFDPAGEPGAGGASAQWEAKPSPALGSTSGSAPGDPAGGGGGQRFTTLAPMLAELGELEALTARELEVLALIGRGMATRDIAERLDRSPRTVERHCDAIHKKLGTSNRVQMARYAMRAGLTAEAGKLKRV
ncbi:MAG: response regulator transcription factor [Phycisphaerales bacterium JB060]